VCRKTSPRDPITTRDLTHTWELVRGILEENYAIRRTLDYYACKMFCARQEKGESVASWGSRIDQMQIDLREAARRVCKEEEIKGAVGLINHLGKIFLYRAIIMNRFKRSFVVGESPSSYLKPSKSRSKKKAPFFPCVKNLELWDPS